MTSKIGENGEIEHSRNLEIMNMPISNPGIEK